MRQLLKKITPLRRAYYFSQISRSNGQADEGRIISALAKDGPKTFVEFGFDPTEFNCLPLAKDPAWEGQLIDGSARKVDDARFLFPHRVKADQAFLTLENLDIIRGAFPKIGVLSIDVDGNDYWFLKALIDTRPALISVEYNSTLGQEPISVPYDPMFDRHEKHPRGWYHGASLTALCKLCAVHGYGLAAVSEGGANAFFTERGKLDPVAAWKPNALREKFSGVGPAAQWQTIRNLPFVCV
jgi:hypothetical protein